MKWFLSSLLLVTTAWTYDIAVSATNTNNVDGVEYDEYDYNSNISRNIRQRRKVQAVVQCGVCTNGGTLGNPGANVPAGTFSWLPSDTVLCLILEYRAAGGFYTADQCNEIAASTASIICECTTTITTPSSAVVPVPAPITVPVPTPVPTPLVLDPVPVPANVVVPTSPTVVVTTQVPVPTTPVAVLPPALQQRPIEDEKNISAGGIAGLAIGGMAVLAIAVYVLSRGFQQTSSSSTPIPAGSMNRSSSIYDSEGPVSGLDTHTDPFAQREGRTLVWSDVNMTLTGSGKEPDRELLKDVWGEVPAKETTAIMGPSGAGKSSLLNILAGRARTGGRIKVTSDIRLNNFSVDPTRIEVRQKIAFVAQDDSLQVTATPREAIKFSAKLRLSSDISDNELNKLTNRVITELGLVSCADTIVGGELIKGISGGERKRTSVGVELVVKPSLIFLDEPTSGLDSFSAVQLCQVLKKVANAGASVLFTIHQPSSEIFNSFDRLILLNKGRVMYQGSVFDVPKYFGDRGHPNPPNYNPADWVMQVAQSVKITELDNAGFFPKDDRELDNPFVPGDGMDILGVTNTKRGPSDAQYQSPPPGVGTQVSLLFGREMKNLKRDTVAVGARFGLTIFLGTLIGIIFYQVGKSDSAGEKSSNNGQPSAGNIQSHFGALIMVALMSMFGTAQPALLSFPSERPVFLREFSTNHYSTVSYFLARFTVEAVITALQVAVMVLITYFLIGFRASIVMLYVIIYSLAMASTALAVLLGCAVEDPKLGQEMLPLLFVPQMLFAGFFVRPQLIPAWLRWAQYLCTLTYSVRLLLLAEFNSCATDTNDCYKSHNPVAASINSQALLSGVDADEDGAWWYWLVLISLFFVFRVSALFVLRSKATKFY